MYVQTRNLAEAAAHPEVMFSGDWILSLSTAMINCRSSCCIWLIVQPK